MNLKVGDKVKFLNEEGGGIVSKIVDNNMVYVTIEDGFDIPTERNNVIKIESQGAGSDVFAEDYQVEEADEDVKARAEQQVRSQPLQPQRGMEQGIYLVFQTEAAKPPMVGNLDVYILNNTGYKIYFSLYTYNSGDNNLRKHGFLPANNREYIETINREQIEQWTSGLYQILYVHEDKPALAPANDHFRIRPKRFYKEENFQEYPGWNSPLFAFQLSRPGLLPKATEVYSESAEEKAEISRPESEKVVSRTAVIDRHITGEREAKVDLHIEQLVDDYQRMNSMEILNTQLNYFRRILESALINNIQRLIIIHGVGAGILKAEIRRTLGEYDYIEVHDAPIADYGVGATIARIFQD
ncbi:MAG: DUF2027 domain-containing protein [Bacteroidales bacterium]|nr:DUF2027 domain-containing protein [Bacteroidales bacterium]